MQNYFHFLLVFFAAIALDWFYAKWVIAITERCRKMASLYSVLIGLCGYLGLGSVISNRWLLLPYLAGLAAGTWLATNSKQD